MSDRQVFTFPASVDAMQANGDVTLKLVINTTLSLRRAGHKTRLAERVIAGYEVVSVVATPPVRPSRKVRLHGFGPANAR